MGLQHKLNAAGADPLLATDGQFGGLTHAAVLAFQRGAGLTPDGLVGPKTHAALNSSVAQPSPADEGSAAPPAGSTAGGPAIDSVLGPAGFGPGSTPEPSEARDVPPGELPGLGPATFGDATPTGGGAASADSCEQGPSFVNTNSSSGMIGSIFFCTDRFDLDLDNDVPELQELKAYEPLLAKRQVKFVFVGFADVRGSDLHNQTLSENRAKSVEGFVRNLLKDHPNYVSETQGQGEKSSFPGFLPGARRVDILAEPAVRPQAPPQKPVPGSLKSRDWKAKMLGSGGAKVFGGFDLLLVDKANKQQMKFVFKAVGPGVGTPGIQFSSDFFEFSTSLLMEFHQFEGLGTWRSTQLQVGIGPSTDVVVLLGPLFNVGNEPVELRYEDVLGTGLGIGVSVFGGNLSRVDPTPSPAP